MAPGVLNRKCYTRAGTRKEDEYGKCDDSRSTRPNCDLGAPPLAKETQHHLNLFLRHAKRITDVDHQRETVYDGDVTDTDKLTKAMSGSDLVYANLGTAGMDQAKSVVKAMDARSHQTLNLDFNTWYLR